MNTWGERYPEKNRAKTRKWRKNNPDKALNYLQEWRKLNPDKVVYYNALRRARRRGGEGMYTMDEWITLKKYYNNCCLGCGHTEDELHAINRKLVPDHVIPISKGGSNHIDNIQPLCHGKGGCNNIKNVNETDYRPNSTQKALPNC